MTPPPTELPDSPMRGAALRYFLAVVAVATGVAAVAYAGFAHLPHPAARWGVGLWFAGVCAAAVLGLVLPARWPAVGVVLLNLAVLIGLGLATAASGSGLQSPALSVLPLMACLVGLAARPGQVRWVALGCLGVPVALAWAEWQALLPGTPVPQVLPLPLRLVVHCAAIGVGLGGGRLVARIARQYLASLADREQRFAALLGVAADALFETNAALAVVVLQQRGGTQGGFQPLALPQTLPLWQLPGLLLDDSSRTLLEQQMQARAPLRNLPAQQLAGDGTRRYLLLSADPRLHPVHGFTGYGGLLRDVTDEVLAGHTLAQAEQARQQSQRLLERVVATSPDVITLTDLASGRYEMVNPAFLRLLGWDSADEVVGRTSLELGIWADTADRERLVQHLRTHGRAEDMDVHFRTRGGVVLPMRLGADVFQHQGREFLVINARDTTERRRDEAMLAQARDAAEAANRAKSAFLANTSHEIRTPLNALVGLARLARAGGVDTQRRHQYLEQIGESAEALSAVISDILDLSKIEAGKLRLETVPFDLHELLSVLHHAYAALADARGLRCTLELGLGVPRRVWGDPLRVRQVLANYLSNALKFTTQGGLRLVVHGAGAQQALRFEVHDTGCGMAPEQVPRLFQPFSQLDDSSTRRVGGTGLGLSICRELAALMGGTVGVHSEPGQGSCFWASLPLPEAAALDPHAGDHHPGAEPLRGLRMLVVEDNPVNLMIGTALLQRWGAEVREATDGEQAVAAVQRAADEQRPFALVLMDLQMPGMGGLQAAQILRRQYGHGPLCIVALTAAALAGEREAALAAGMDGFVTKPIDDAQLLATLRQVLAQRHAPG